MIIAFYKLKGLPFDKTAAFIEPYRSGASQELLSRLEYLKQHRGMMLITGEPGSGKTTIVHHFAEGLSNSAYQTIYLPLSTVSTLDFYRQLNKQLTGELLYRKADLYRSIQANIQDLVLNKKRIPVIILDEAHLLRNENIPELQILANFAMDSVDPAIFILIGQSQLRERLERSIHASIYQRFIIRFHMQPLSKSETREFIEHHLAQKNGKSPIFSDSAYEAIYQTTSGNPRLIGKLVLKAMYVGAKKQLPLISEEEVYQASQEM